MSYGALHLTVHFRPSQGVEVNRADPVILVSDNLLTEITGGSLAPWATYDGVLLRLDALNGLWVYRRTGERVRPASHPADVFDSHVFAWPD